MKFFYSFIILWITLILMGCQITPTTTQPQHGAIALQYVAKDSATVFMLFQDGMYRPISQLKTTLQEHQITHVTLSSFDLQIDTQSIIHSIESEPIIIEGFYTPQPHQPIAKRKSIYQTLIDTPREEQGHLWPEFIQDSYNIKYKMGPLMDHIKYITIHNTAEPFSAYDEFLRVNHRRDSAYVSFHFAIDEIEVIPVVPLPYGAWHAGDKRGAGNTQSIGIEICRSTCYEDSRYNQAEENAIEWIVFLMKTYQIPIENIKKHQDWSGKYCPHRILEEGRWDSFKARILERYSK